MRSRSLSGQSAPGRETGGRRGVWAGLLCLLLVGLPGELRAQLSVYPATVELEGGSGIGARTLTVQNQGDEPVEVRIYRSDYDRTPDGGHSYPSFGEHPSSCAGRLEVFPDQLTLEPGGQGEVRLRLDLDGPTCWGMVFVEKRTLTASGITVAQRIGVKVLAQSPLGAREGRVLGVALDSAGPRAARIAFGNEGGRALDVDGEIEVRDLAGEIVEVVPVDGFRVLPGRTREVRVPLDGLVLDPGRYLLVAILDFGGEYLAGGQALLEVKP